MTTLTKDDLTWVLMKLPESIIKLMESNAPYLTLAGGFIRSIISKEKPSDIDLFFNNAEEAKKLAKSLGTIYTTDNAYSVKLGKRLIQFIHKWTYTNPVDLLESFDFTVARAAIWFETIDGKWSSKCDHRFYSDLAAKRLCYTGKGEPGGSLLRLLKFYRRGFNIPVEDLALLLSRLTFKIDDIGSTDSYTRTQSIRKLLREVDPLLIPEYLKDVVNGS